MTPVYKCECGDECERECLHRFEHFPYLGIDCEAKYCPNGCKCKPVEVK